MAIGVSTPAEQSDTMGMIEVNGLKASSARDALIKSRSRLPSAGLPPLSMPRRGTHVAVLVGIGDGAVVGAVVRVAVASSTPCSVRKWGKPEGRHIIASSSSPPRDFIVKNDESYAYATRV